MSAVIAAELAAADGTAGGAVDTPGASGKAIRSATNFREGWMNSRSFPARRLRTPHGCCYHNYKSNPASPWRVVLDTDRRRSPPVRLRAARHHEKGPVCSTAHLTRPWNPVFWS